MDRIHPKLVPYVTALTSHEFGLQGVPAEVENIECGSIVAKSERKWGDRFQLRLLYCTKRITWQVLMCPNNLRQPPDFILQDDFLADIDHSLIQSKVPSLIHWEPSNPKCLLNVVLELLELYKQCQSDLLRMKRESRLSVEYNLLMTLLDLPLSHHEIYVYNPGRVSFLLHLRVDFSKLPIPLPNQKHLVLLFIELGENTKNVVSLFKHRELDDIFVKFNLIELSCNMVLVEYVRRVEGHLQSAVEGVILEMNKKKMFYCLLVQALEPALLNGDNITFRNVSFLLELNNQYFLLNIEIPSTFPNDRPILNVSAIRKSKGGGKLFVSLKNFNYDSKWDVQKIFRNIYDFIKQGMIPQFNKFSGISEGKSKKCQFTD